MISFMLAFGDSIREEARVRSWVEKEMSINCIMEVRWGRGGRTTVRQAEGRA